MTRLQAEPLPRAPIATPRPVARHRLEYAAVRAVVAAVRVLPDAGPCSGPARCSAWPSTLSIAAHRRLAVRNLRAAFPLRSEAERRAIAREMFAHFGRLLAGCSSSARCRPRRCWPASSSRARSGSTPAHAHGRGVLLFTGHFGFWEINALVHALALQPMAVLARPLDNPLLHRPARIGPRRSTGNSSSTAAARSGGCCARSRPTRRSPSSSISTSSRGRGLRGLLQSPGGDDVGAGGAGAAHRGAGRAGVRAAAARRPLPHGLRASGRAAAADDPDAIREFTQRCTDVLEMYVRRYPELWLWMHRRWRDVGRRGRRYAGMFPSAAATSSAGRPRQALIPEPAPAPPARIVIRAPNWLGDAVMALPAMAAMRAAFPAAHLTVAAAPSVAPMFVEDTAVVAGCDPASRRRRTESAALRGGQLRRGAAAAQFVSRRAGSRGRRGSRERWGYARQLPGLAADARRCRGRAPASTRPSTTASLVRGLGFDVPIRVAADHGPRRDPARAPTTLLAAARRVAVAAGRLRARRRLRPCQALAAVAGRGGHRAPGGRARRHVRARRRRRGSRRGA